MEDRTAMNTPMLNRRFYDTTYSRTLIYTGTKTDAGGNTLLVFKAKDSCWTLPLTPTAFKNCLDATWKKARIAH